MFRLILEVFSTLFSKCFDFILVTFPTFFLVVSTLFSKYYDFILVVFRLYSRNISTFFLVVSTLFSKYYDFNLVILDFFFLCGTKTLSYNPDLHTGKKKKNVIF